MRHLESANAFLYYAYILYPVKMNTFYIRIQLGIGPLLIHLFFTLAFANGSLEDTSHKREYGRESKMAWTALYITRKSAVKIVSQQIRPTAFWRYNAIGVRREASLPSCYPTPTHTIPPPINYVYLKLVHRTISTTEWLIKGHDTNQDAWSECPLEKSTTQG